MKMEYVPGADVLKAVVGKSFKSYNDLLRALGLPTDLAGGSYTALKETVAELLEIEKTGARRVKVTAVKRVQPAAKFGNRSLYVSIIRNVLCHKMLEHGIPTTDDKGREIVSITNTRLGWCMYLGLVPHTYHDTAAEQAAKDAYAQQAEDDNDRITAADLRGFYGIGDGVTLPGILESAIHSMDLKEIIDAPEETVLFTVDGVTEPGDMRLVRMAENAILCDMYKDKLADVKKIEDRAERRRQMEHYFPSGRGLWSVRDIFRLGLQRRFYARVYAWINAERAAHQEPEISRYSKEIRLTAVVDRLRESTSIEDDALKRDMITLNRRVCDKNRRDTIKALKGKDEAAKMLAKQDLLREYLLSSK